MNVMKNFSTLAEISTMLTFKKLVYYIRFKNRKNRRGVLWSLNSVKAQKIPEDNEITLVSQDVVHDIEEYNEHFVQF